MRKICLPLVVLSLFIPVVGMAQKNQDKVQKQNTAAVARPVITGSAKGKNPGDKKTNQKKAVKNKDSTAPGSAKLTFNDGDGTGGGDVCTLIAPTISGGGSICPGNDASMSTGNITGGTALQWQSSPVNDPNSFTNINGANSLSYTAMNVVTTTYYRTKLSQGNCSIVSPTIQVTVTEAPINLVINVPATECSPSMVNLAAPGITIGSEPGLYFFYFDANSNPLVSSLVSTGGTYYIEAYRNSAQTGCSIRKPVSVTINTPIIWIQDFDQDGYYAGVGIYVCPPLIPLGIGWTLYTNQQPGDCEDFDANVHPGATEICDNIDNNCNGQIDENGSNIYYRDGDGDGFGNPTIPPVQACVKPSGYSNNNTDCNDNNALINPNTVWIDDSDQDGYYSGNPIIQCASPGAGYFIKTTQQGGDCNDNDATIHSSLPYYLDNDDDGYGAGNAQMLCSSIAPEGYSTTNNDCDDTDDFVYPGAPEICDGKDNDCDGQIDEGVKTFFYKDNDNDGFGNAAVSTQACTAPAGYVDNNTDCNDNSASVNPGAIEQCGNGVDDDCDGLVDEGCGNLAGIFVANTVVIEGNQGTRQANFVLLLNKRSSVPVTVKYETVNGSATAPQDYIAKSGTITFPANTILQNLKIDIVGDATNEANETFKVKLSQPVNANLINTNGSCVILNDDLVPLAKIKDTTVLENQGTVKLRISLSAPSGQTVKVKCSTRNGTAIAPNDYTTQENILVTFAPGVTNMYATIPVVFDYINEPVEYFKVKIVSAENALLNTATRKGKVSITNVSRNNSHRDNQPVTEVKGTDTNTAEKANPTSNKLLSHEPVSLAVQAWPNPTTENFTINMQSGQRDAISIRVHDVQGRLVLILDKLIPNSSVKIGKEWGGGLYFAEIVQGDQRRIIKLIKQN